MTALTEDSRSLAAAIAIGSLGALPAGAHHSTAAFDNSRVIKIEGTITQFRWINPHASIKIDGDIRGRRSRRRLDRRDDGAERAHQRRLDAHGAARSATRSRCS